MVHNKKTETNLREVAWWQRTIAILTCICLVMSFILPSSFVLPIVAMSADAPEQYSNGAFNSPWEEPPTGAMLLKNNLSGITVEDENSGEKYGAVPVEVVAVDSDTYGLLKITMSFSYTSSEVETLKSSAVNRYVYYQIPDGIEIKNQASGPNAVSIDPEYSTTLPSGYYTISDTGLVVLQFTEAYMNYVTGKGFGGSIDLECNAIRAKNADGDQKINMNDGNLKFDVTFPDRNVTMRKEGNAGTLNGVAYVDWNITITNPGKYHDMTEYTLSDVWTANEEDTAVVFDASNVISITPEGSARINNGKIVFNNSDSEYINITYRQSGAPTNTNIHNKATLTHATDSTKNVTAENDKLLVNEVKAEKSGKPDYQVEGFEVDDTPEIEWYVDVENKLGQNLAKVWVKDDKFTDLSDSVFGIKVYDVDGNLLTLNTDYSISGDTLTFLDGCSVSKARIAYRTAAEINTGQRVPKGNSNSVTIGTNDVSETKPTIPEPEVSTSVDYNKEMLLIKDHDGNNAYHHSVGTNGSVKWYIRLVANATSYNSESWATTFDDESKETLDGYTITDDAFIGLTANDFSINAFHSTNSSRYNVGASSVTITKVGSAEENSSDSNKILVTVNGNDVNDLEIYYMKELTNAEKVTYDSNQLVTVTNDATASGGGQTMDDGDTYSFQTRTDAKKEYGGISNSNNVVYGDEDKTDRELYWKIGLIKDQGFSVGDTSVVDVMEAKKITYDENGNKVEGNKVEDLHYITSDQISTIKLYGKVEEEDSWTEITNTADTTYYTVTDGNGNSVTSGSTYTSFKINFESAISSTNYRYINVDYHTTAKTSSVDEGDRIRFTNGVTFGGKLYDSTDHPEFERKDIDENIEPLTLKVAKTWADGRNIFNTRPSEIKVKVEYAPAESDGSCPADNSASWQTYTEEHRDGIYTLTASSNGDIDNLTLGSQFPQWKKSDDNKRLRYWYRIKEVDAEGNEIAEGGKNGKYTVSYQTVGDEGNPSVATNIVYAERANETLALINTCDQKYAKTAIDANGDTITSIDLTTAPKATVKIDGVDTQCYIFGWKIQSTLTNAAYELVDRLPEGLDATFITKSNCNSTDYLAYMVRQDNWEGYVEGNDWLVSKFEQTGNEFKITGNGNAMKELKYYIAIPVSKAEKMLEDKEITNSVEIDKNPADTATVTITASTPIEEEADILDKEFHQGFSNGYLTYDIIVNPEGKTLAKGQSIEIVDELKLDTTSTNSEGKQTNKTLDDLTIRLKSITGYPFVNGVQPNPDDMNAPTVKVPYRVEYDKVQVSNERDLTVTKKNYSTWGQYWVLTDWEVGDTLILTASKSGSNRQIRFFDFVFDGTDTSKENSQTSTVTFNETSKEVIIPENTKSVVVYDWNAQDDCTLTATAKKVSESPARLYMDIDDSTPMLIRYVYTVAEYVGKPANNNDVVMFENSASIKTNNVSVTVVEDGSELQVHSSTAQTFTTTYLTIYKTDVNDDSGNLSATFHVQKYDNGSWVNADSIQKKSFVDNGKTYYYRELTFGGGNAVDVVLAEEDNDSTEDDESLHNFSFGTTPDGEGEAGIYRFIETVAPAGYDQVPAVGSEEKFTFYYAYRMTNLMLVLNSVHILIHAVTPETINKYLSILKPDKSTLNKINILREKAHNSPI